MNLKKLFHSKNIIYFLILISIILNFSIESLSRHSIIEGFLFLKNSFLVFLYNSFLILFTLSFSLWFKKRFFLISLISITWFLFGLTNSILLSNRITPFTAIDFSLIKSGLTLLPSYMSKFQILLLIISVLFIIFFIIFLWFFAPQIKEEINYKKITAITLTITISMFIFTNLGIKNNLLSNYFSNIAFAYEDYGFAYCFSNTLLNKGISESDQYSKDYIDNLKNKYNLALEKDHDNLINPNIIMVQLESFFDITNVKGLEFSEDPIPNFRNLTKNYSSGYLTVPTIGAGTANTEFEILTGMSLEFFGAGEYPYKTVLQNNTTESIAYNLKPLNYTNHAIHNNIGIFYDRNKVFSNLGFDTFISSEYMDITEFTENNWAKDKILTKYILNCLNSTKNSDFIYSISVQAHGEYPSQEILKNPKITLSNISDEKRKNSLTYYVNQLNEVDLFIKDLITEVNKLNEKTIIVFFGDHLPNLNFNNSDFKNSNIFQTQYVIYDNFNLKKEDNDLTSYQLNSSILKKLNIKNGILNNYHQNAKNDSNYYNELQNIQYDMLYGENYLYNNENPYIKTDLIMGLNKPKIDNIKINQNDIIINGDFFSKFSTVFINDKKIQCEFLDSKTLILKNQNLEKLDVILIKDLAKDNSIYNISNEYIY